MFVNLKLNRIDYAKVDATSRGCMRLVRDDGDSAATGKRRLGSTSAGKRVKYRVSAEV